MLKEHDSVSMCRNTLSCKRKQFISKHKPMSGCFCRNTTFFAGTQISLKINFNSALKIYTLVVQIIEIFSQPLTLFVFSFIATVASRSLSTRNKTTQTKQNNTARLRLRLCLSVVFSPERWLLLLQLFAVCRQFP